MKRITFLNGREVKNIDPWNSEGEMWQYASGKPEDDAGALYAKVAAVYRAVNFTADTLSNVPFAIVNAASGEDVDTSDEWTNALGFLNNPRQLIRLMTQSLIMTNKAFAFQEMRGRTVTNLRYIAPATISIKTDTQTGEITSFVRTLGTRRQEYPVDKNGFCNIVYMFNLNWKNELLPDDNTPFSAMMNAAGIGYYADLFIKDFFARGGIKPTILTFEGVLDQTSAEKVESIWYRVIRGWYKYLGKVFNGKFTPVTIGDGVESLKQQNIYDNALRNICIAVGMPQDVLLQNADNRATAMVHRSTWFSDTLIPLAMQIAEPFNEQVFERLGYRFEFRAEASDPDMEEERSRVGAAQVLYDILSKGNRKDADKVAIEALGIDLPEWFNWETNPEPEIEDEPPAMEEPETDIEPVVDEEQDEYDETASISLPQLREMKLWQDIAFRKHKRGDSLVFDWTPKDIPAELAAQIKAKLDTAQSEDDIRAAFENVEVKSSNTMTNSSEIKLLAEALNKLAESKAETVVPSFNLTMPAITLTAQMPEQGSVIVNVPDQPPPVVNVTNEVNPAVVQVEAPTVNVENMVQPAPVTVAGPKQARVVRDRDGRIEGIQSQ